MEEYIFKIIILGSGGVGKSSLIRRFTTKIFTKDYISGIGVEIHTRIIYVNDITIRFILFDTAGQEYYTKLRPTYYMGARAVSVVFDVTNEKTFEDAKDWWKESHLPEKIPGILIGNKIDLIESRMITSEMGETLAKELKLSYIETSAKTGENVGRSFYKLVFMILEKYSVPLSKALCPYCGTVAYILKREQLCYNCNNRIE
ncbi:MAG: GTP-binding protein [Promethearchaeota archaeon]